MNRFFCLKMLFLFTLAAIMILGCSGREEMPLEPSAGFMISSANYQNGAGIDSNYIDICYRPAPVMELFSVTDGQSDVGMIVFDPKVDDCCENINEDEYTLSPVQPEGVDLLNDLLGFIEIGYFSFTNEHHVKPYRRKLEEVVRMLESGNSAGARQKLINDLFPHTTAWIETEHQQQEILAFLELAEWRILNPDADIYLATALMQSYTEALEDIDVDAMGCRVACTTVCTLTTYNLGGCILLCLILCPEPI
ncbi:hypothetical protein KAU32_04940 [bacterium]|nr:hypothetical protein [bacterium]